MQPHHDGGGAPRADLEGARSALLRLLDALTEGVLLCHPTGGTLHSNDSLLHLLEREPEAPRLRAEIEQLLEMLRATGTDGGMPLEGKAAVLSVEVRTAAASYRLRGSQEVALFPGVELSLVVIVQRLTPELPDPATLKERFGLSRKESAVALLLGVGRSSAEIAAELHISPHTARRHAESVLRKLGVRSRAEVANRLFAR